MSKKPEFVVTGLHIPAVHFWARVIVSPERLQQVKESILQCGQVLLNPGEVLQVDTQGGDEITNALTVTDNETSSLRATCLVAWNGRDDVTIYGDGTDFLAAVARTVEDVLLGNPGCSRGRGVNADDLLSIQVGDVQVFFPRKEEEEPADEPAEREELSSRKLPRGVKVSDEAESLRRAWIGGYGRGGR